MKNCMTNYEYLTYRREYAEERCREAQDSYIKTFWAKIADQETAKAKSLTVEEAAQRFNPFAF